MLEFSTYTVLTQISKKVIFPLVFVFFQRLRASRIQRFEAIADGIHIPRSPFLESRLLSSILALPIQTYEFSHHSLLLLKDHFSYY